MIHVKKVNNILDAPTEKYDHRLNKKIIVDPSGIINLRKFTDDMRYDDGHTKKIVNELETINDKYNHLKEEYDKTRFHNDELKHTVEQLQEKNKSPNHFENEKEIIILKEENKSLMKKVDILVSKLNLANEEVNRVKDKNTVKVGNSKFENLVMESINLDGNFSLFIYRKISSFWYTWNTWSARNTKSSWYTWSAWNTWSP